MNLLLSNNTGCTFNELTRVFFIAFLKLISFQFPTLTMSWLITDIFIFYFFYGGILFI